MGFIVKTTQHMMLLLYGGNNHSWCQPCKAIQPFYEQSSAQYAEKATFLTVDVDDFDSISNKYSVAMMPTFLVVQGDQVLGTYRGSSEPQLEAFLKEQLA
jgi:thiol-disulfide isomerase/thioredoxin